MKRVLLCSLAIAAMLAPSISRAAPGPVFNGEFELTARGRTPFCNSIGNTYVEVLPQEANPHLEDPTSPGQELPWPVLTWIWPCEAGAFKAATWSSSAVTQFYDVTADGDREAHIDGTRPFDPATGKSHNFWQSYANAQQAYTADFESLRFRIEDGTVPGNASVRISLSTSPLAEQHPYVGIFVECTLAFGSFTPVNGVVERAATSGTFTSAWEGCDAQKAQWDAADDAGRMALLSTLRIVQLSFWNFESSTPIVIDGVELVNAKILGAA